MLRWASMEQDLSGQDFKALTPSQRVSLCRKMADEASELAKRASPNFRLAYTILALQWMILADEIAREAMGLF